MFCFCHNYLTNTNFCINRNIESFGNVNSIVEYLTISKIEILFKKYFEKEFKPKFSSVEFPFPNNLIKSCVYNFVRSKKTDFNGRINYIINFCINVNDCDFKTKKKELSSEKEICFFNFKVSSYQKKKTRENFLISYFSEINVGELYQGCGLFSTIFKAYTEMLRELRVDVDYLHVNSKESFTASIYNKRGYQFTPDTIDIINNKYNGTEKYLKNSSISYDAPDYIEMYRNFNGLIDVKTSIADFEREITSDES